jgi:hypothetical protein
MMGRWCKEHGRCRSVDACRCKFESCLVHQLRPAWLVQNTKLLRHGLTRIEMLRNQILAFTGLKSLQLMPAAKDSGLRTKIRVPR